MTWDELCILSAIRPGCGPLSIALEPDELAQNMATEILSTGNTELHGSELLSILKEALRPLITGRLPYPPAWLPKEYCQWRHANTCIAVGHFNERGVCRRDTSLGWDKPRFPAGKGVQTRRVCTKGSFNGRFLKMIVIDSLGEETEEHRTTVCSAASGCWGPNFFLLEECYKYLEEWVECTAAPRQCDSGEALSFSEELYEIVNSRKEPRDITGLPALAYGDILKTFTQWQDYFSDARCGSAHTAAAIASGARSADLIPAVLKDCQAWLFMRPDIWPSRPDTLSTPFTVYTTSNPESVRSTGVLGSIPIELFISILSRSPLATVLAVASASKKVRTMIGSPQTMGSILKESIRQGPLRWIQPVATVDGECDRVKGALSTWLPVEMSGQWKSALFCAHFPLFEFIRACYASDSMRNRRRLWGMVKQFDILWKNYRMYGYERDIFLRS